MVFFTPVAAPVHITKPIQGPVFTSSLPRSAPSCYGPLPVYVFMTAQPCTRWFCHEGDESVALDAGQSTAADLGQSSADREANPGRPSTVEDSYQLGLDWLRANPGCRSRHHRALRVAALQG